MKRIEIYLIFILFLSFLPQTYAEDFSISSSVDKEKLSLGEGLTLTIKILGKIEGSPEIKLPELKDFEILSRSTAKNISIKSGKVSYSNSFAFKLRPKTSGKLTIGSVKLKYKSKLYITEPIEIEVLPAPQEPSEEGLPEFKGEIVL